MTNDPKNKNGFIEWELEPTYQGQALRVQDMMIMHIVNEAAWEIPIYFAVTVSQQNRIGLDSYLDMEGLTFHLKSHKTKGIDKEKMFENLMTDIGPPEWSIDFDHKSFYSSLSEENSSSLSWSKNYQPGYMFRNLGNEKVYFNKQTNRLLQNYRSAYVQLAFTYYLDYMRESGKKKAGSKELTLELKRRIVSILNKMSRNIPEETIPIQSGDLHHQIARIYGDLDEKESMREIMETLINQENSRPSKKS